MKIPYPRALLAAATLLAPALAQAHPGHDGHDFGWDFGTGLTHPLLGWDHLAAMLAVGLWAAQLGGRARWLVPASCVTLMVLGAALAQTGWVIPGLEQTIAVSVLLLGLLIAFAARLPVGAGMALVGLFAVFHGFAHGTEMPATVGALMYGAGFVLATAALHAAGLVLGLLMARRSAWAVRFAGWIVAASGVMLLAT